MIAHPISSHMVWPAALLNIPLFIPYVSIYSTNCPVLTTT